MRELPILINIVVVLAVAFAGGFLARCLKLPTLVGYLLAGMVIGPFTPGFVGDLHTIEHLAELGVIFLLFGVGLHFSLRDLWAVRDIAVLGALLQMALSALLGVLLTRLWGWTLTAGMVVGLAVSVASTIVVIRNLMDQSLLNTSHGQVAVGWLVLEDLAAVLVLVLMPVFVMTSSRSLWQTAGLTILKMGIFAALMLVVGRRIIPWMLLRIAHLRSRELFIASIVVITLGTAVGAASLFGVSLALGAFLAGVVINESELAHQVEAEILPFRETFAILFFVSIGMLVNPILLLMYVGEVISLLLLIILGNALIVILLGLFFARPARTILVLAISLSQIGEFSFLLGQTGVSLKLLSQEQYALILMSAMLSITLNPFLFRLLPWIEACLRTIHPFWSLLDRHGPAQVPISESLRDHVVIIGCGRVGRYVVEVLSRLGPSCLVIELDAGRVAELQRWGVPTLYGDAANSDILSHAHLAKARAVVVTLPNESAAESSVAAVHDMAPQVPLLARATTREGVHRLFTLGASTVIYPELEGGLQLLSQTLVRLGYSEQEILQYTQAVRTDHYNLSVSTREEQEALAQLETDRS